jgi:DNA helicase-2/ATP-dependent DNA helicase PcrA
MNFEQIAHELAISSRSSFVAPAGCGKTELIVRSVGQCDGPQLVLTHTHAGVRSLRARFRKYGISNKQFHVTTIDGFAKRYAVAYPRSAGPISTGLLIPSTGTVDWDGLRKEATNLFELKFIRNTLLETYSGIFVDEYQDCTASQHRLILNLANVFPCRVLGDPLQGIFLNSRVIRFFGAGMFRLNSRK